MTLHFLFVQFEFTHAVGPSVSRYIVKADGVASHTARNVKLDARNFETAGVSHGVGGADVLVVSVRSAPVAVRVPHLLRRARPSDAKAEPDPVPLSILSFVTGSEPLDGAALAGERLAAIRASPAEQQAWVNRGLEVVNTAIRAHRIMAPDPYAIDITRRDPRSIRIGHGTTDEVQNNAFTAAIDIPPAPLGRVTRYERLRPAESVAAVLAGRHEMLESEDLLGRVLIDLDHGRTRAAAHQAAAAMRLLRQEVDAMESTDELDLFKLAAHSRRAMELAEAAEPLGPGEIRELEDIVDRVAESLDAWRAYVPVNPEPVSRQP